MVAPHGLEALQRDRAAVVSGVQAPYPFRTCMQEYIKLQNRIHHEMTAFHACS